MTRLLIALSLPVAKYITELTQDSESRHDNIGSSNMTQRTLNSAQFELTRDYLQLADELKTATVGNNISVNCSLLFLQFFKVEM